LVTRPFSKVVISRRVGLRPMMTEPSAWLRTASGLTTRPQPIATSTWLTRICPLVSSTVTCATSRYLGDPGPDVEGQRESDALTGPADTRCPTRLRDDGVHHGLHPRVVAEERKRAREEIDALLIEFLV
jgi:hypothetical protein